MDRLKIIQSLKAYDPTFDEQRVNKAIDFAIHYHGSQTRESGDPYYKHPLEVAEIIISMKLDSNSVITALLHDTVEDTELTLEDIKHHFGEEVAKLVDGVTKLSKIEFMPAHIRQAENFRKLLLAMSEDIRVLLVKLADRLHNMRTINYVKSPDKRNRIAIETMEIYAPLAERIGAQQIKIELQDICFSVLQPEVRQAIITKLDVLCVNEEQFVKQVVEELQTVIKSEGVKGQVYGRRKTPFSIWMKMQQKKISVEQLSDIIAFRIIVDSVSECYLVLGCIHTKYKMVPENFQDFISTPKNNSYQSLHTVVIGPLQQKIEIQIRTQYMHQIAELGVAAHWRYKQQHKDVADGKQYRWIRELLMILEQSRDSEEFLQNTKLAMYYDQVFCFTPKGNLVALPKGASAIDFAYMVHSDIGHHCSGAKINGRLVPIKTLLQNGDQVEIITSRTQTPSIEWEKYVVTGRARSEIRKFARSQQKWQYTHLGKLILDKAFKSAEIKDVSKALSEAYKAFNKKSPDELYYAISDGSISREDVLNVVIPKKSKLSATFSLLNFNPLKKKNSLSHEAIPINGLASGIAMHYAGCCHPLPGDDIVGVIHTGTGVTVHTSDCNILNNFVDKPGQIIKLSWHNEKSNIPFVARLEIIISNETGSLAALTSVLAKEKINIINLKIIERNVDFFKSFIDIQVLDLNEVAKIISLLQGLKIVHNVERVKK